MGTKRHRDAADEAAIAPARKRPADTSRTADKASVHGHDDAAMDVTDAPPRRAQSDSAAAAVQVTSHGKGDRVDSKRCDAHARSASAGAPDVTGEQARVTPAPKARCWSEGSGRTAAAYRGAGRLGWRVGGLATFRAEKRLGA